MTVSRADTQAKIDAALAEIKKATTAPATMVARHGDDPAGWTPGHLQTGFLEVLAARDEVGHLVDPDPAPPPPPPSRSDPDPFVWDATTATLDPNSDALVKDFVGYALPHGAYIAPNIAYDEIAADGSTAEYPVSTAGHPGGLDPTIYVPVGAQASIFNDHHLTIIDWKRGRQHDLWLAAFTNGKLTGWKAGCSLAIGALQQPDLPHYSSNGSNVNGMAGVLRPEQIVEDDLSHPFVFACPAPGAIDSSHPARYPANTTMGWPNPGHLPPAAWLRFPPDLVFPAMDATSLYVCKRIQKRGWFLVDLNSSDLSIKSGDRGGGGRSRAAWQAAGVSLGSTSFAFKLSSAIPWSRLQVLRPPPK